MKLKIAVLPGDGIGPEIMEQGIAVMDAIAMRDKGMSADEIVDVLMREKLEASIYITVDTLKYLKKVYLCPTL